MHEEMMTVAVDKFGNLRDITEVENGLACECFCIICGGSVIARQGDILDWSFAHVSKTNCTGAGAGESALHKLTIERLVLRLNNGLSTGPVSPEKHGRCWTGKAVKYKGFDYLSDASCGDNHIEVCVTHACEPGKEAALREFEGNAFEIIMGRSTYFLKRDLDKMIDAAEWRRIDTAPILRDRAMMEEQKRQRQLAYQKKLDGIRQQKIERDRVYNLNAGIIDELTEIERQQDILENRKRELSYKHAEVNQTPIEEIFDQFNEGEFQRPFSMGVLVEKSMMTTREMERYWDMFLESDDGYAKFPISESHFKHQLDFRIIARFFLNHTNDKEWSSSDLTK